MELKDFLNFVPQFPLTGFDLQSFLLLPIPAILIWNFGQDVIITGTLPKDQQVPKALISSFCLFLHYYLLQDKVSEKCHFLSANIEDRGSTYLFCSFLLF